MAIARASVGVAAGDVANGSVETVVAKASDEADRARYRSKLEGSGGRTPPP